MIFIERFAYVPKMGTFGKLTFREGFKGVHERIDRLADK